MNLNLGSQQTALAQIAKASVNGSEFWPDNIPEVVREQDYIHITIVLPLVNREGYQPYLRMPLESNTAQLVYWHPYACWIGNAAMVFVPESREVFSYGQEGAGGLLFTQENYHRLCLRHEGVKAQVWYEVDDSAETLTIEPVTVYIATDLSVYDGTSWYDRHGTYQNSCFFPTYDEAYTYICGMYDGLITTLNSRILEARKAYARFIGGHKRRELAA